MKHYFVIYVFKLRAKKNWPPGLNFVPSKYKPEKIKHLYGLKKFVFILKNISEKTLTVTTLNGVKKSTLSFRGFFQTLEAKVRIVP
jgi:hypothetical protein